LDEEKDMPIEELLKLYGGAFTEEAMEDRSFLEPSKGANESEDAEQNEEGGVLREGFGRYRNQADVVHNITNFKRVTKSKAWFCHAAISWLAVMVVRGCHSQGE
jgi:hypothetical protein